MAVTQHFKTARIKPSSNSNSKGVNRVLLWNWNITIHIWKKSTLLNTYLKTLLQKLNEQQRYKNNQDIMSKTACLWSSSVYTSGYVCLCVLWPTQSVCETSLGYCANCWLHMPEYSHVRALSTLLYSVTASRGSRALRRINIHCSNTTQANLSVIRHCLFLLLFQTL